MMLSACIAAFWLVTEVNFLHRNVLPVITLFFACLVEHVEFMEHGESTVKPNIAGHDVNEDPTGRYMKKS